MDKNSMLYWWPLVRNLDIPMPRTHIVEMFLTPDNCRQQYDTHINEMRDAIKLVGGYPVFMRTDLLSGKHQWSKTCYYEAGSGLWFNIHSLLEASENCDFIGRPVRAIVFRQYIEMDSAFRAFSGLPISRERRYFVRDGNVESRHPYWPQQAINFWQPYNEPDDWHLQLHYLNCESEEEVKLLSAYVSRISDVLDGYWSVDFCKGKDGVWYFIDCAKGEDSWHPECDRLRGQGNG